jgi:hypothetical protein
VAAQRSHLKSCALAIEAKGAYSGCVIDPSKGATLMSSTTSAPYVAPSIRDFGDLVELTASATGGFSDVPRGGPIAGCPSQNAPSCFS